MTTPSPHHISLFEPLINVDFSTEDATHSKNFSILDTLTFSNSPPDWWAMTLSIFIWMALSYAVVFLSASIVAAIFMRKHPYVVLVTIPMALMSVVGPATVGLTTSMAIAFTLSASDKYITHVQCCLLDMNNCIGAVVAVDCGPEGYFQGKLAKIEIEDESRRIILSNAFRDGMPCGKLLRLDSSKIVDVKVLKTADSVPTITADSSEVSKKIIKNPATPPKNQMPSKPNETVPLTPAKEKTLTWVSRPLNKGTLAKTESSSTERDSSIEKEPKMLKRKSNRHKEAQAAAETIETTPTPLFKRYEPQVPKPQSLTVPAWAAKSAKKGMGPCGIPILDVQNGYGPISRRNAHLDNPIDFDELAMDFDFDTNLNLFDKDNFLEADDENFYESVEKSKMSQNFKHDENILSNPARVTSWTTTIAKNCYTVDEVPSSSASFLCVSAPPHVTFSPKSFENLSNGNKIPSLDSPLKIKYLEACRSFLSPTSYSSIAADRIISYFCDIVKVNSLPRYLIVTVLTDAFNKEIANFLTSRFGDRGHKVYVYSDTKNTSSRKSSNPNNLPSNPHLIISLQKKTPPNLVSYLQANPNSHILSLESRPPIIDFSKVHILMMGVFTAGLPAGPTVLTVGKTTFAALCGAVTTHIPIDCRIADIGAPFSWIIDGGAEALSAAFSTDILVQP